MPPTQPQTVAEQALALSPQDRIQLAQRLWDSLTEAEVDIDRQTVALAKRRDDELASGKVHGMSHEQVMRAARESLR